MPTLTLKYSNKVIREYHLEKGGNLKIGRRKSNDIVIENLAVSGEHARVDSVRDGFMLTDLHSKNGSFVNEQLISTHLLQNSDIITIGKHSLVFQLERKGKAEKTSTGTLDQTMVMDTEKHREMLKSSTSETGKEQPKTSTKNTIGVLAYLSGGEGEIILTKKMTKIGKDPSSDIVISGLMVGKPAATISRRPNAYFFSYVGGMAKPKINGEVVKETVKLKEFDAIEIGSVKMQFIINEEPD